MGRRALNAVGVAAALLQAPADSFMSSSTSGNGRVSRQNGSAALYASDHLHDTWTGLRRPIARGRWRSTCVRGGHGPAGEGVNDSPAGQRRPDATGINSKTPSAGIGSLTPKSVLDAGQDTQKQVPPLPPPPGSRTSDFPLPSSWIPPPNANSSPDKELGSGSAQNRPDNWRERAGFSLFRCDAYHCEREMIESGEISASSPTTTQVMMRWNERPRRALVLLKPEQNLLPLAAQTIDYLQGDMGLIVMVEAAAADGIKKALNEFRGDVYEGDVYEGRPLEVFTPPERSVEAVMGPKGGAGPSPPLHGGDGDSVDFVLTLGGDGLLMYSNTLFRRSVPPHLCFNLGSMGFLTPFEYELMKDEVRRIMSGGMKVSLRMRLSARIIRDDHTSEAFHALNEIVIDRGSSPYLTNLECLCDEQHLTTVQADGLIIATPTGSTAYSMSAGGSMVHPCVPAILFTPICPHSLSFRPIVFPDTVVLQLRMPEDARAEARVSFDGKLSQPLRRGDTLVVKTSNFPVPTICKDDSTADWFTSLDQALGFNTRMLQRAFQTPTMDKVRRARNDDRYDE